MFKRLSENLKPDKKFNIRLASHLLSVMSDVFDDVLKITLVLALKFHPIVSNSYNVLIFIKTRKQRCFVWLLLISSLSGSGSGCWCSFCSGFKFTFIVVIFLIWISFLARASGTSTSWWSSCCFNLFAQGSIDIGFGFRELLVNIERWVYERRRHVGWHQSFCSQQSSSLVGDGADVMRNFDDQFW